MYKVNENAAEKSNCRDAERYCWLNLGMLLWLLCVRSKLLSLSATG